MSNIQKVGDDVSLPSAAIEYPLISLLRKTIETASSEGDAREKAFAQQQVKEISRILEGVAGLPYQAGSAVLAAVRQEAAIEGIQDLLGKNFYGKEYWSGLGVTIEMPDLVRYPRLTPEFLDGPFEYDSNLKRSEAGVLIVCPRNISLRVYCELEREYCAQAGVSSAFCDIGRGILSEPYMNLNQFPKETEIHFVVRDVIADTLDMSWQAQIQRKKSGFDIIGIAVLAQAIGAQWGNSESRETSFASCYGRTRNTTATGSHALIGDCSEAGARFAESHDVHRYPNVGLALEWQLKTNKFVK